MRRVAERLGRGTPDELLPAGRAHDWNQAMMELGATVCGARTARCEACPVAAWCASRGRVTVPARAAPGTRERFEDSTRWVRGRIVAALAAGRRAARRASGAERLEPALAGLVRDGLVVVEPAGARLA